MSSLFGKRILRGAILSILAVFCVFAADQFNSTKVEAQAKSDSVEITDVPFSLSLNGNNAALSVAHSDSLSMTGAMTLEAWVKPFDTNGSQMIIDRMTQNLVSGSGGYQLRIDNGVAAFMICSDDLRIRCVTTYGTHTVEISRWQHIAAVFENGKTRVYFNGQTDGQRFKTTRPASFAVGEMTIGASHRGRNQFRGLLDEIRICNTAIYNGGFSLSAQLMVNQSTVGLWRFDNGSVNDWSIYNHPTTIVGMATFSPDVPVTPTFGFRYTPTPSFGFASNLADVKVISPNDVWSVGSRSPVERCCFPKTAISQHWDGTQWSDVPVPAQTGFSTFVLKSVDASSSTSVWAIGEATNSIRTEGRLLRFNGTNWVVVANILDPDTPQYSIGAVNSISVISENDIWIVGSRSNDVNSWTLHWDGTSLQTVPSPTVLGGGALKDVVAINSNNVLAVGRYIAIRWNGVVWQKIEGIGTQQVFKGVAPVSETAFYTIGLVTGCGPFEGCSGAEKITYYDGANWSQVPSTTNLEFSTLQGISASDPANVWIAGRNSQNSLVLRLENGAFRRVATQPSPVLGDGYDVLTSVSALNANEVWTVGETDIAPASANRSVNLALRGSLAP